MFEDTHSIDTTEPRADSDQEHLDQNRQQYHDSGELVNAIVSLEQDHSEGENINEKLELIRLEPQKDYEIPNDSRVSRDQALQNLSWDITEQAKAALDSDNVMAVIRASDQSFWLLDMRGERRFVDASVPYLLIEADTPWSIPKNGPHARSKGIRSGGTLVFGRDHDYDGRFDYSDYVSRNHFAINCKDGGVSIKDLDSKNGTSIIIAHGQLSRPSSHKPYRDEGGKNYWDITPRIKNVRNTRQQGNQLFITLGDQEYPCLTRDAETFNMSVDALDHDSERSSDILIDGNSPEIQEVYDKLERQCSPHLSMLDKLTLVEKTVRETMPYNHPGMVTISKNNSEILSDGSKLTRLSDYVRGGAGVCRQQALLSACLLEKMKNKDLISGIIHIERNWNHQGSHEWATFQETPNDSVYVIDAAMKYVGQKEKSPYWDYRRP